MERTNGPSKIAPLTYFHSSITLASVALNTNNVIIVRLETTRET